MKGGHIGSQIVQLSNWEGIQFNFSSLEVGLSEFWLQIERTITLSD